MIRTSCTSRKNISGQRESIISTVLFLRHRRVEFGTEYRSGYCGGVSRKIKGPRVLTEPRYVGREFGQAGSRSGAVRQGAVQF